MDDWRAQEQERERVRREARALPREPLSRWVVVVVAIALVLHAASLVWQVAVLPDRVPQHWSGDGPPDRWASKAEAITFAALLPLIGFALVPASRLVTTFPDALNVPNKDWWLETPHRVVRFERLLREDLLLLACWELAVVLVGDAYVAEAARRPGGVLDPTAAMVTVGCLLVALLGYVAWMYLRRYRSGPAR